MAPARKNANPNDHPKERSRNAIAQHAHRERKKIHIANLEARSKQLYEVEIRYGALQAENMELQHQVRIWHRRAMEAEELYARTTGTSVTGLIPGAAPPSQPSPYHQYPPHSAAHYPHHPSHPIHPAHQASISQANQSMPGGPMPERKPSLAALSAVTTACSQPASIDGSGIASGSRSGTQSAGSSNHPSPRASEGNRSPPTGQSMLHPFGAFSASAPQPLTSQRGESSPDSTVSALAPGMSSSMHSHPQSSPASDHSFSFLPTHSSNGKLPNGDGSLMDSRGASASPPTSRGHDTDLDEHQRRRPSFGSLLEGNAPNGGGGTDPKCLTPDAYRGAPTNTTSGYSGSINGILHSAPSTSSNASADHQRVLSEQQRANSDPARQNALAASAPFANLLTSGSGYSPAHSVSFPGTTMSTGAPVGQQPPTTASFASFPIQVTASGTGGGNYIPGMAPFQSQQQQMAAATLQLNSPHFLFSHSSAPVR